MNPFVRHPMRAHWQLVARRVGATFAIASLALVVGVAQAVGPRVDVLNKAALSQLTHSTCTVSPPSSGSAKRFLMVEGPSCPLGGGGCQHVALMNIDRTTVALTRVAEPSKSAKGAWSSQFKANDMTLKVDLVPRANDVYAATMTLQDGKGGTTKVKGVARCDSD